MADTVFRGQSTKESYKQDIEDSRNTKKVNILYEYFDDHSYSNATDMGILLKKMKGKPNLILFANDGPQRCEILTKLLQWRKTFQPGTEIGHKGSGNLRLIYGHPSSETILICKLPNGNYLRASTRPDAILALSKSDTSEEEYRGTVDGSRYVQVPQEKDEDELEGWYLALYKEIEAQSGIEPKYMIRMVLSEIPGEYSNPEKWRELINQIRAKQYKIPIHFKNELLSEEAYTIYDNIDLVGIHGKEPNEKIIDLFIDKETLQFYFKNEEDKYVNVDTNVEEPEFNPNILLWGKISMYIVQADYLKKQLNDFNKDIAIPLKAEESYGVYIILNGKLTNYRPAEGSLLGASKNNGIIIGAKSNTNLFRLIIDPDPTVCKDDRLFSALLVTNSIKALTGFLDKSPYKKIIKNSMDSFKGISSKKASAKKEKPLKPKPTDEKEETGIAYLVYLGSALWKYGMVNTLARFDARIEEHKKESVRNIKHFTKKVVCEKYAFCFWSKQTNSPLGDEEQIGQIINERRVCAEEGIERIKLFKSNSAEKDREYFICADTDYILYTIIPALNKI